ncbi:putative protease [Campylobacterota bacterium]|nr:putative protease [Campylobacterota bacterium]
MIELLSPAGDPQKMRVALAFGADAVYGGVSHFSLRLRSSKEFSLGSFGEGIAHAHQLGKKVYVAANGFPFNSQLTLFENHIAQMRELSPDAFIVASAGTVRLTKKVAPDVPIHLSTQANVLNTADAEAYYDMGVKRVIAAREMSLRDLEAIKAKLPDLELEVFVHGSMCFAYSGRCLISSLQSGRVPNRGSCANDCRFPYRLYAENPETGAVFRVEESEEGSFIFNAKDLKMIAHLEEIAKSGVVDSIKIEGRTKSVYYAGCVTRAYRMALDDMASGRFDLPRYESELATTKNRGFSDGFLVKRPFEKNGDQNLLTSQSEGSHTVTAIVDVGGRSFHALGTIQTGEAHEIVAPKTAAIAPCENEIGSVFFDGERAFVRFNTIQTEAGKTLTSVHSGNTNAILLPCELGAYTFLRKTIL